MNYYNSILIFINIICNNAFILTHNINLSNKAKLYKNKRSALLMTNISDSDDTSDGTSASKSFYDFIKQRNITLNLDINVQETNNKKNNIDENYVENYITKFVENYEKNQKENETQSDKQNETLTHKYLTTYNSYEKYIKAPLSKDLKMLTPDSTREWAKTWTFEMIHEANQFPTFMFHDMFKMRDFFTINSSRNYFYIGFFPKNIELGQWVNSVGQYYDHFQDNEIYQHSRTRKK
jgi:hypothetical protein